ncbi:hypothetical protein AAHZ94_08980 [Streptomyces sp. HSW2009]|uniref:hypothetical protein n=1 Tax=Streptomyces sp. HSW2009 TaxID=3142890 RepID=UPI0032EF367E
MRTLDPSAPHAADLAPLADRPWHLDTHRDATAHLVRLGWTPCGVGDWAVGLRSPSGHLAARVCPFDPAYAAFVELCRRCAGNPYLPRVESAEVLDGGGTLTILEFLAPLDGAKAVEVKRQWDALPASAAGLPGTGGAGPTGLGAEPPRGAEGAAGAATPLPALADDPDFMAVYRAAHQVNAEFRATMPWWDGIDLNEGNVRRALDGRTTLIDVFCMDGAALYAQVIADADVVRTRMGEEHTRHLLDIPYIARESSPEEIRVLREAWGR